MSVVLLATAREPRQVGPQAHRGGVLDRTGATPKEIAARAGHTSVSMVLDRYGHLLPGTGEAVTDRLEQMARAARDESSRGADVVQLGKAADAASRTTR